MWLFRVDRMKVRHQMMIIVRVVYWVLIALIPVVVWIGQREYLVAMEMYSPKDGVVVNDFELYWCSLLSYSVALLWPLSVWKIFVAIRNGVVGRES